MVIRKFTIVLALLSALALSCKKDPSVVPSDNGGGGAPAVVSGNIQGTVVSKSGDPIEGVVVSDGLHCTMTNAKGEWGLEADLANTDYVFVSTPSDYSAPLVDGTPVFWKFLKDLTKKDGKYSGVTFTLEKIPNPNRFTVLFYADPQPRPNGAGYDNMAYHSLELCNDMYKDMKEVVDGISNRYVYGVGLGDIVHEHLPYHATHRSGMASTGVRNYNVIGNHDHDTSCKTNDRDAARPFESVLGPANYSFDLGDLHFLILDNMIGKLVDGKISNSCDDGLTDEIWQWMQNDLSFVPKEKTIMVCAHSPMFRMIGGKDRSAKHAGDYKALLHKYKKVLAWAGHTHTSFNYVNVDDPVIESHTLTRVTGELWTNEYLGANGTPRGYVVFDYNNGDYSWKFKPMYYQRAKYDGKGSSGSSSWDYTGPEYKYRDWDYDENGRATMRAGGKALDDSYQMQLFGPTLYGDGYIYANIFMWDELWKSPRFTSDGYGSGKMTRVTTQNYKYAFSMKEIRDYYVANNPALAGSSYKFEANNTESLFCFRPTTEHGTGKVSVEDRFGNNYSSTITW